MTSFFLPKMIGSTLACYFQLVYKSSRVVASVEPCLETVKDDLPAIFTFWHGEQFLIPAAIAGRLPIASLVSRNKDGEFQAAALQAMGMDVIRGSGGRNRARTVQKGGIEATMVMLTALEQGKSVGLTANVPRGPAREVSKGAIMLAKLSGRPIFPVCHVSRRNISLNSWDQALINLPFTRSAFLIGEKIDVSCDADETHIEIYRKRLQAELERINEDARRILRESSPQIRQNS